jgi:hypothetical protein
MENNALDMTVVIEQSEGENTLSRTTLRVEYPDLPNDMANDLNNGYTEAIVGSGIAFARSLAEAKKNR